MLVALENACVGKRRCVAPASRALFGVDAGKLNASEALALSVVVACRRQSAAEAELQTQLEARVLGVSSTSFSVLILTIIVLYHSRFLLVKFETE